MVHIITDRKAEMYLKQLDVKKLKESYKALSGLIDDPRTSFQISNVNGTYSTVTMTSTNAGGVMFHLDGDRITPANLQKVFDEIKAYYE